MSRRFVTIIIIILVALIIGLFVTAFLISRGPSSQAPTDDIIRGGSPFGEGAFPDTSQQPTTPRDDEDPFAETPSDRDEGLVDATRRLRQLSTLPSVGGVIATSTNEIPVIRYVDRASGNVFEVNADGENKKRVTNTTLLGIHEALWEEGGERVIMRYLDDDLVIKTFSGVITPAQEGEGVFSSLEGVFLPDGITQIVSAPDEDRIFYLTEFGGKAIGTTADFDGSSRRQVFEHDLSEWILEWPQEDQFGITTAASAMANGYTFLLNDGSSRLSSILRGLRGLATHYSPTTEFVLFSSTAQNDIETRIFSVENEEVRPFALTTLPEKCLWSEQQTTVIYCAAPERLPFGTYPDDWYKGLIDLQDNLWRIDVETGAVSLLISPHESIDASLDIVDLFLSNDEEYLFFTNKIDGTLWSLKTSRN